MWDDIVKRSIRNGKVDALLPLFTCEGVDFTNSLDIIIGNMREPSALLEIVFSNDKLIKEYTVKEKENMIAYDPCFVRLITAAALFRIQELTPDVYLELYFHKATRITKDQFKKKYEDIFITLVDEAIENIPHVMNVDIDKTNFITLWNNFLSGRKIEFNSLEQTLITIFSFILLRSVMKEYNYDDALHEPENVAATCIENANLTALHYLIASGKFVDPVGSFEYCCHIIDDCSDISLISNLIPIYNCIACYMMNPIMVTENIKKKIGWKRFEISDIFSLVVATSDGYFDAGSSRFVKIASVLPIELQMLLCNLSRGSRRSVVSAKDVNESLKQIL